MEPQQKLEFVHFNVKNVAAGESVYVKLICPLNPKNGTKFFVESQWIIKTVTLPVLVTFSDDDNDDDDDDDNDDDADDYD